MPKNPQDYLEELREKEFEPIRRSGVYVIFDAETDEPLYVGQATDIHQRLNDHMVGAGDSDLRPRAETDSGFNFDDLRDATKVKWVEVDGDRSRREEVERRIEEELEPRYRSE